MATEQDLLKPLLTLLRGEAVPIADLVGVSRKLAGVLISAGKPISVATDGQSAGIWNLERLTDDEVVAWGMWVASKIVAL